MRLKSRPALLSAVIIKILLGICVLLLNLGLSCGSQGSRLVEKQIERGTKRFFDGESERTVKRLAEVRERSVSVEARQAAEKEVRETLREVRETPPVSEEGAPEAKRDADKKIDELLTDLDAAILDDDAKKDAEEFKESTEGVCEAEIDKLSSDVTCKILGSYIDHGRPPIDEEWYDFLQDKAESCLIGNLGLEKVESRIKSFRTYNRLQNADWAERAKALLKKACSSIK